MSITLFYCALKLGGLLAWAVLLVLSPLWVPWAVPRAFASAAFGVAALINLIAKAADHE